MIRVSDSLGEGWGVVSICCVKRGGDCEPVMDGTTIAAVEVKSGRGGWWWVQWAVWGVGMFIWVALIAWPRLGLHLLWNVLIPVAPALLVLAPGVWRNVCPLGSMAMAPSRMGWSRQKQMAP